MASGCLNTFVRQGFASGLTPTPPPSSSPLGERSAPLLSQSGWALRGRVKAADSLWSPAKDTALPGSPRPADNP